MVNKSFFLDTFWLSQTENECERGNIIATFIALFEINIYDFVFLLI